MANGDGSFQPALTYDGVGNWPVSIAVSDFNGDGKLDLAVANNGRRELSGFFTNSTVSVLLGKGDGTLQPAVNYALEFAPLLSFSPRDVMGNVMAVADLNGDGKPDLIVGGSRDRGDGVTRSSVSVLLGKGDGTFAAAVSFDAGGDYRYTWIRREFPIVHSKAA